MSDRVLHSRKLAAFRELEDADRALQRARAKFADLGLALTAENIERRRVELQGESVIARGALGLDDQLRRVSPKASMADGADRWWT